MRKATSLPVRLASEQKDELLRISKEMDLTPSAIVRLLINSFLDHYDRQYGLIEFPLKFVR